MADWLNPNGLGKLGNALLAAVPAKHGAGVPRPTFLWYLALALLSCAILVGVMIAIRVWREINEDEEPATNEEILDQFRQAYAEGEIDEAEFRRVTALLTGTEIGPPAEGPSEPPPATGEDHDHSGLTQGTGEPGASANS